VLTQDIGVDLRVRLELGYWIALTQVNSIQSFGETTRVALDQRPAKISFPRKVIVQAGLRDLQLGCHVGITETVEAAELDEPLSHIQDPG
jgi:hypothetical protein